MLGQLVKNEKFMKKLFGFLFFLLPMLAKSQVTYKLHKLVLQKGIVDSEFIFGKWDGEKDKTETHIKYLGQFTTKSGKVFKIINSFWIWGLSGRGTTRILIFDSENKYIGEYYIGGADELPEKLFDGKLIFNNKNRKDCDKRVKTTVNLTNGLPKHFFLKCKGDIGDIYSFTP